LKASLSLKISCVLELIGEIRWCCPVQTLVHENSELELDPIQCSQPVQLLEERRDVEENTSRAAEFRSDWSCWRRYDGMPAAKVALP